jgi:hypothetical protein
MKPKLCKTCKTKFTPDRQFQFTCSFDCAIGLVKFNQAKKAKKDWVKEKAERKEKIMTKSDWEKLLQILINNIARLIDHNQPCIATGATTGKRNGGHRFSVGSNATIRFNLHNIHIQSEHSNSFKGGDNDRFDEGLERIYGLEYKDYVRSLNKSKPIMLTIPDIKEKIAIATRIKKELIELNNTYTTTERIDLRHEYNKRIGIYLECF